MPEDTKNKNNMFEEQAAQTSGENQDADAQEMEAPTGESDPELLLQELAASRDQLLRLAAEFENFKKRMEREREALIKYAGENILRELLSTVDNLDRALEQGSADSEDSQQKLDAMLEGVGLTRKGLLATLEKFEVIPIESIGKEFDPNEHEALTMEPSDTTPANHVMREFLKGYRFRDRLLRPSKVVVSGGKG